MRNGTKHNQNTFTSIKNVTADIVCQLLAYASSGEIKQGQLKKGFGGDNIICATIKT